MYVAIILDMDDIDPYTAVGPFDTIDQAIEAGDHIVDILSDVTLNGHAHPHEWDRFIVPVQSVDEVVTRIFP